MTNKFLVIIIATTFWLVVPFMMGLVNTAGYNRTDPEALLILTSEDFNILTLDGFGAMIDYVFGLAQFTIQGLGKIFTLFFLVMGVITAIAVIFFLRGGG